MGKSSAPRRLAESEARAFSRLIRSSPRKLNLVAQLIRGENAGRAISLLTFSKRRVAGEVRKVVEAAVANAENNHQLDVDRLFVAEAFVGRGMVMKRFSPRARGRAGRIEKPWSNLTVIVREREETA